MGLHTRTGAFAALSNVRNRAPRLPHELSSRGELVARVLRGDDAAVESGAFSAFNMIWGTAHPYGPSRLKYGSSVPDQAGRWRSRSADVCGTEGCAETHVSKKENATSASASLSPASAPAASASASSSASSSAGNHTGVCFFKSNESTGALGEGDWPKVTY